MFLGLNLNLSLSGKGNMYANQKEAFGNWQDGFGPINAGNVGSAGKSVPINIIGSEYISYLCKKHGEFSKYLSEVKYAESKVMTGPGPFLCNKTDIWIHIGPAAGEGISHAKIGIGQFDVMFIGNGQGMQGDKGWGQGS